MADTLFIRCSICDHEVKTRVERGKNIPPSAMVKMYEQAIAHLKREHYRRPKGAPHSGELSVPEG